MSRFRQGCPAVLLALAAAATAAHADIRVKVRESVNGAEPVSVVHWFGPDRSMRDDGDHYIITRLDQGRTYVIDRTSERYRVVDLELEDDSQPAVEVEATDDRRVINGWSARRYHIEGPAAGDLQIDVWTTDETGVDIAGFRELMVRLSGRAGSEWMKAYREIPGFPVLQTVELSRPGIRLRSRSEVIEIERAEPEAHTYEPPEDFERISGSAPDAEPAARSGDR